MGGNRWSGERALAVVAGICGTVYALSGRTGWEHESGSLPDAYPEDEWFAVVWGLVVLACAVAWVAGPGRRACHAAVFGACVAGAAIAALYAARTAPGPAAVALLAGAGGAAAVVVAVRRDARRPERGPDPWTGIVTWLGIASALSVWLAAGLLASVAPVGGH